MSALSLTEKDLENLKNHKYSSGGKTKLDELMNPFWEYCSKLLPYKITPNMVTVIGFIFEISCSVIIGYNDLTLTKEVPIYVYITCAFFLFLAQTFDAIDGKHARNTKRASPLGQLMDHGCDAFGNFIHALCIMQAHVFGSSYKTIFLQIGIQAEFLFCTIEENFTKTLRTNISGIGVTEFQFLAIGLILVPVFIGQYFSQTIIYGYYLVDIIYAVVGTYSIIQIFQIFAYTFKDMKTFFKNWYFAVVYIIFAIGEIIEYHTKMYQKYPLLLVVLNGVYFGIFTSKVVVYNMANKKLPYHDIDALLFFIGIVGLLLMKSEKEEKIILVCLTTWAVFRIYTVIIRTIKDMLAFLKIPF